MEDRLTYRSAFGDYGSERVFDSDYDEICALRDALGPYEDLNLSAEQIRQKLSELDKLKRGKV